MIYDGFHDMVLCRVRGTLPQDREKMLQKLDQKIAELRDTPPVYAILTGNHQFSSNDVGTDQSAS